MKPDRLVEATAQALARGESLAEIATLLRRLRDRGLSQSAAYDAVEALRVGAGDMEEDRLLEVLDIVSGFCAPGLGRSMASCRARGCRPGTCLKGLSLARTDVHQTPPKA